MSGGKALYEKTIAEKRCQLIAMQVFAAGTISPREAIDYVCSLDGIESILLRSFIAQNHTRELVEHHDIRVINNSSARLEKICMISGFRTIDF